MSDYYISWIWLGVIMLLFSSLSFFLALNLQRKFEHLIGGFVTICLMIFVFTALIQPEDPWRSQIATNPYIHHVYLAIIMIMVGGWLIVIYKWNWYAIDKYDREMDDRELTKNYGE